MSRIRTYLLELRPRLAPEPKFACGFPSDGLLCAEGGSFSSSCWRGERKGLPSCPLRIHARAVEREIWFGSSALGWFWTDS